MSLRIALCASLAPILLSCGQPPKKDPIDDCKTGICGDGTVLVMDSVELVSKAEDGTVRGFNLDNSEESPAYDCDFDDYTDPEGNRGIDNQLAVLMPAMPANVQNVLPTLLQNSVNGGGLLLYWEFVGLDDPKNDDKVHVVVHHGKGVPLLGTDNRILFGQTMELASQEHLGVCKNGTIKDGVLNCGPFPLKVVIMVFGKTYVLPLDGAYIRMKLSEDLSSGSVLAGGAVTQAAVDKIADTVAEGDDTGGIIKKLAPSFMDLMSPGAETCDMISGTIAGTMRRGYAFKE